MKCKNFEIKDAIKYSKYTTGEFCSKLCTRSFSSKDKRLEINKKVSETLKLKSKLKEKQCLNTQCNKTFRPKRSRYKFCSRSCSSKYRNTKNPNICKNAGICSANSQQKRNKNEIYFYELCKSKFNSVKHNENIFNGWDADVIIDDIKFAVLWNGK